MPKFSPTFAFVALALWLLGNWLGAHGHVCFDGQEPPVSVHMHLDAHSPHAHHPDEVHQDADIDLGKSVPAKQGKIELGLVLLAALALVILLLPVAIRFADYPRLSLPSPLYWRPLLRAPPLTA